MAVLKRRWRAIVLLAIYVGVAVGGYAYFAAQNPATQLAKVASEEKLTSAQSEAKEFLIQVSQNYALDGNDEFEFPSEFGEFPVTDQAQKEGAELIKEHLEQIKQTFEVEIESWGNPGGITTTYVESDAYGDDRIRPLSGKQAGIGVTVAVTWEHGAGDDLYGANVYLELGLVVDGPSQTITGINAPSMQGW